MKHIAIHRILHGLYFMVAFSEIVSESLNYKPGIIILKPLIPLILIVLYTIVSTQRKLLFFLAMFCSALTNILFTPNDNQMLFFGIIAFMFHRIFVIWLIYKVLKIKEYIPVVIATIPLLMIFFYLFAITEGIPENSFWILIIQNFLIAILGGIALSNYLVDDEKKNMWLLICGLLFVALQFIIFLERYYLSGLSPTIFRPVAMALNVFAFYTFYRFVIATENQTIMVLPADEVPDSASR
ncbi:MAG TPA: lysoplasmalogenase family protein [Flavobacterium sp.]